METRIQYTKIRENSISLTEDMAKSRQEKNIGWIMAILYSTVFLCGLVYLAMCIYVGIVYVT